VPFPGELSHEQAMSVLRDLSDFRIPALILSGGEPMSRFDFWELAEEARRAELPPPVAVDQRHQDQCREHRPAGRSGL
jgi:MoaA/NifB/PqqE/SkfB family radical SAM enzyme